MFKEFEFCGIIIGGGLEERMDCFVDKESDECEGSEEVEEEQE